MPLQRQLYAYALSILGNESDAADCIQEAFTKLWMQRSRIDKINNPEGYALVTVKNIALNIATRRRQGIADLSPGLLSQTHQPEIIASEPGPSETLEARERLNAVAAMIRDLPESQRRVVLMSALNGLSNSEIRKATGLSDDNVRVLLSRGRKKLRELFTKWMQKDI